MTDDEQDAKDWQSIKKFFDLKSAFNHASAATARSIHTPGKAAVVTAGTGIGGVVVGSLAIKAALATAFLAVGTVASFITFNPLAVLLLGALTIGAGAATGLLGKGAAWLLGAAKGAFLDAKYDNHSAPQTAVAPATEAAPSAGMNAKPAGNDFNRSADPAAVATTDVKAVQPEKPRDPVVPGL